MTADKEADALVEVAEQVDHTAREQRHAAVTMRRMAAQRRRGLSWQVIMRRGGPKLGHDLLSRSARHLRDSAGRMRRLVAGGLWREGVSTRQIGQLFDISHQRISSILRSDEDT